jgi:hypothetical protein
MKSLVPKTLTRRPAVILSALALACSPVLFTSCAVLLGGAIVAGTVAFAQGSLESHLAASVPQSADAVHRAIYSMKLTPMGRTGDNRDMTFQARDVEGQKIKVRLEPEGRKVTKVTIRIGNFGDETMSRAILAEIDRQL